MRLVLWKLDRDAAKFFFCSPVNISISKFTSTYNVYNWLCLYFIIWMELCNGCTVVYNTWSTIAMMIAISIQQHSISAWLHYILLISTKRNKIILLWWREQNYLFCVAESKNKKRINMKEITSLRASLLRKN